MCLKAVYERWCLSQGFPFLSSFKARGLSIFDPEEGGPAVVVKPKSLLKCPVRLKSPGKGGRGQGDDSVAPIQGRVEQGQTDSQLTGLRASWRVVFPP